MKVLITGASSGIGLELAKVFASNKHDLVLISRDKDALSQVAKELNKEFKVKVQAMARDLTKMESCREINKTFPDIDILVNNAGFGDYNYFKDMDENKLVNMINLNIMALTYLTRLYAPIVQKNKGKILNVASVAGFFPGPRMATYYATKNYVVAFSLALREELKPASVSVLCPGATKTNFEKAANAQKLILFKNAGSAKKVAEKGYQGLMKNKAIIFPSFINKFFAQAPRLLPRPLIAKLVLFFQK